MEETERDLFFLAILGVVAYFLLSKGTQLLGTATAPISDAIANAWLAATLPANMTVLGGIAFPDGSIISINDVQLRANQQTGAVQFMFAGHLYNLSASDANGNWPATLIQ
jgi:hypothetical protein